MLDSGKVTSQAELARHLNVSRARVTQVLRLLRLDPEVLDPVATLGDPLPTPVITERLLRPFVDIPPTEQKRCIGHVELSLSIKKPQNSQKRQNPSLGIG
jgi:hypothetical protein